MEWNKQSFSKKLLNNVLSLLVIVEPQGNIELPIRILGEIQILIIFCQLCINHDPAPGYTTYHPFDFIDVDSALSEAISNVGKEYWASLLYIYVFGLIFLLIWRLKFIQKDLEKNQSFEYTLLLIHSTILSYYLNVIVVKFLDQSIAEDTGWDALWIILLLFNNFFGIVGARFTANLLRNSNMCSVRTHAYYLESWVYRFIDVLFNSLITGDMKNPLRLIAGFTFLLIRYRTLSRYEFYHFKTQKIFYCVHGIHISFLIGALVQTIGDPATNFSIYLSIGLAILLGYNFYTKLDKEIVLSLAEPVHKLQTVSDFEKRHNIIDYVIEHGAIVDHNTNKNLSQLVLQYLLFEKFPKIAGDVSNPSKGQLEDLKIQDYSKAITELGGLIRKEVNQVYLIKHSKNLFLKLTLAYYNIQNAPEHKYSTILDLMNLSNLKQNYEISTSARKLLQKIYSTTFDKIIQEENVDVRFVVEYVKSSSSLTSFIKQNTQNFYNFWSESRSKLTILDILRKATKIETSSVKIEECWHFLKTKFPRSIYMETVLYSVYLLLIRGHPGYSLKIFNEKLNIVTQTHSKEDKRGALEKCLTSSSAMVLIIERLPSGREKILHLTKSIEFFGYSRAEIQDKGFEILIPSVFKSGSSFSLLDFVEKNKGSILGKNFRLYLKNSSKIISLMDCYITLIQSNDTLAYLLTMDFDKQETTIICSPTGVMDCWTENLENEFSLTKYQKINQNKLSLFDVFHIQLVQEDHPSSGMDFSRTSIASSKPDLAKKSSMKKISSTRLSIDHLSNEYLKLTCLAESSIKYTGRKSGEFEVSPNLIFVMFKAQDSELDDLVPNERFRKIKTIPSKAYESIVISVHSNNSNSSISKIKEDTVGKKLFNKKNANQIQQFLKVDPAEEELEIKLHKMHSSMSLAIIHKAVIVYILMAVLLSCIYLKISLSNIENIPNICRTSISVNMRHYNLWEWIWFNSITLKFIWNNLWDDRQGWSRLGYFQSAHSFWPGLMELEYQYDREILDTIPQFEAELQPLFYTPIRYRPVYAPDTYEETNLFQLDRMIGDSLSRLVYLQYLDIFDMDFEDPRLNFVINNVIDDHYIVEESFFEIIREDVNRKLRKIELFGEVILYFLLSYSILLYSFILYKEQNFIKQRLTFTEALNKIAPQELEAHLSRVSRFIEHTEDMHGLVILYEKFNREHSKKHVEVKMESKEKSFTGSKVANLNHKIYILLVLIFIMQLLVVGVSYLNLYFFRENQSAVKLSISNSIQAAIYMNEMVTLSVGLYAYIHFGPNVTMKNRPFNEIWDICVKDLDVSNEFYRKLIYQVDDDLSAQLNAQFTQDLCTLIFTGNCYDMIHPIVQNGAFGLYAFMFAASLRIKAQIDLSNRTFSEIKGIFYTEDYINLEWAGFLYPDETQIIMSILQTQVERTVERFKKYITISVSCCIAGFILFLLFIWKPIRNSLNSERKQIYDMMKIIPLSVVRYNISMKTFWRKFSSMS